jgi:UDP-3-O-[3-hydroxymyristoyl] N-acetylglucosamine deacetylase
MKQRTINKPIEVTGIGLHSGKPIKLKLEPMEENNGILFYRSDKGITIPLNMNNVIDTKLATTLGINNIKISTIEHLMSALFAFGIDNLRIVIDNEEIPIMDGSAISFIMLIKEAGIRELNDYKKIAFITKTIEVKENEKYVKIEPSDKLIFDYTIYFDHPLINKQNYIFEFSLKNYIEEIAKARTFGFLKEIQYLRSIGLAKGGSLDNAIVLDDKGILNDSLRYPNEFVRHKILDAIGDLSLLNFFYIGKYTSYKGSHKLNNILVKKIIEENAFEFVKINNFDDAVERGLYAIERI